MGGLNTFYTLCTYIHLLFIQVLYGIALLCLVFSFYIIKEKRKEVFVANENFAVITNGIPQIKNIPKTEMDSLCMTILLSVAEYCHKNNTGGDENVAKTNTSRPQTN